MTAIYSERYSAPTRTALDALRVDAAANIRNLFPSDMFLRRFTIGESSGAGAIWLERLDIFDAPPFMPQGVPSCTLCKVGEL